VPYTGVGPHPQIERGRPNVFFDTIANFFSLPHKLLYASKRLGSASVTAPVEEVLVGYMQQHNDPYYADTKYRLNQYAPFADLGRVIRNDKVAWPYRILIGLPYTFISETLLTSRLIGVWNPDRYNPYSNTVLLHSNRVDIALHKSAHARDVAGRNHKGTYGLLFIPIIPFVRAYPEWIANDMTFEYLQSVKHVDEELESYQMLTSSWSGNVGKAFGYPGWIIGAILGHIAGATKRLLRKKELEQPPVENPSSPETSPTALPTAGDSPQQTEPAPI
jgi:hypothetical protein